MKIDRGEIWLTDFDPTIGSEIAKTRPALVVSHSGYNAIARTVTVLPISSGRYIKSFHVKLKRLKNNSHALLPQLRTVSKKRIIKKLGRATETELTEIKEKLLRYLDMR
ncbi:type II toxin-antitoxin system PemK/MazF family toxin [Candidatus Peregrinibacteria bacterium]|nr:type II toxin-antitoxin system PemK/MazF family toxin [Candidatus Peregrinibacteria bacterium]